jgi:hypothetical protein
LPENCGEGGIRTHETLTGLLAFEASSFNRSDTSPRSRGGQGPLLGARPIRLAQTTPAGLPSCAAARRREEVPRRDRETLAKFPHVTGREAARVRDVAAILNAIAEGRAVNVVDRTVWY